MRYWNSESVRTIIADILAVGRHHDATSERSCERLPLETPSLLQARRLLHRNQVLCALQAFRTLWESAKRIGDANLRCRACEGIAAAYQALRKPTLAYQFHQLAISASLDAWGATSGMASSQEDQLPPPLSFSSDLMQAPNDSPAPGEGADIRRLPWELVEIVRLRETYLDALDQNDQSAQMTLLEQLASFCCKTRQWSAAAEALGLAHQIARQLENAGKADTYRFAASRLRNALRLLEGDPLRN